MAGTQTSEGWDLSRFFTGLILRYVVADTRLIRPPSATRR